MIHPKLSLKIMRIREVLTGHRFLTKTLPLVTGLLALVWFLLRVIPKPQRAAYPCMKAAYPLMSGIVIWFLGVTSISAVFRFIAGSVREKKHLYVLGSLVLLMVMVTFLSLNQPKTIFASYQQTVLPVHIANEPFGVPQGIVPGRVVWAWNPEATNENCTNDLTKNDGYFLAKNNNQDVIDNMLAESILSMTNKKSQKKAWNAIFKYFNEKKGKGSVGYKTDETIFIKINQGHANIINPDLTRKEGDFGNAETSPQVVIALLKLLVNEAGVPQNRIIIADPMSHIYQDNYELMHTDFPDVLYGDRMSENVKYGRTYISADTVPVLIYSDKGHFNPRAVTDCLYREMENADYLINIAALKAHGIAGITMCAKNHFGSVARSGAFHLHGGLVSQRGNDKPVRVDYGMYRTQVELMGSKYLGRNTLLFVIDGLWGGPEAVSQPVKWAMEPFNNDWPNSILISLDPVAIESVGFDFLRYEATVGSPLFKNRPNFAQGVDDYLHQAASSKYWPEGIKYDPDNSGTPIPSLGVHEHWNNPVDKQYSGNMGRTEGIELVRIFPSR